MAAKAHTASNPTSQGAVEPIRLISRGTSMSWPPRHLQEVAPTERRNHHGIDQVGASLQEGPVGTQKVASHALDRGEQGHDQAHTKKAEAQTCCGAKAAGLRLAKAHMEKAGDACMPNPDQPIGQDQQAPVHGLPTAAVPSRTSWITPEMVM